MSERKARLETLRDRFVAVSMRSRTLRLVRPSRTGALDLHRLGGGPSLLWLVKVLGSDEARPGVLADVASGEGADPLSLDVAALAHAARAEQMETGADDLAVGWPFLEGRAPDGTWLRAPLLLYPVSLGQTHKGRLRWTLEPAGPPLFNEPLLQTLSRLAGVRLTPADFLARDDDGRFRVDDATWRGLVETLLAGGLRLHETPQALPALAPLAPRDKGAREAGPLDRFSLCFHLVLGRFPAAASTIVLDYDALLAGPLDDARLGLGAALLGVDEDAVWSQGPGPDLDDASAARPVALGDLRRWQSLPSDASQDDVFRFLEDRTRGGLVVQGPPGTGKSQLITNLVAASVARGDRVLLVCQKRAALDVVADRLAHLGLRDIAAVVHDVQRDRNIVCQGIDDTLGQVLDDSATQASDLRAAIARAADAHDRALRQVEGRVAAAQEAFATLTGSDGDRPGLAALDERALSDPGHPLPDLRPLVADVTEADLDRHLPRVDALAADAEPLARPHPLHGRTDWRDYDEARLDDAFAAVRALARALDAWLAVRGAGHLRPRDVDALASTWADNRALIDLVIAGHRDDVATFALFWAWCGGDDADGQWHRLVARFEEARASLAPAPPELVATDAAALDALAQRLDALAALDDRWYRFVLPRYWRLRGAFKRAVADLAAPPDLGDDPPAALARVCRDARPWGELNAQLPELCPFFDATFSGDLAELDEALARVRAHHDRVRDVHRVALRLERFGGPYATPPRLDGDPAGVLEDPFFVALAADARAAAALADLDRALGALAPHADARWRGYVRDLALDDPDAATREVAAFAGARGDAARAIALDRLFADEPPWVRDFLRQWRRHPDGGPAASVDARRAVEWAWRQLLLAGRGARAVAAPLVEPEALAGLTEAIAQSRELTASGVLARYRARLIEAASDDAGRQSLQRLAADARKRRYRATLRQIMERHWRRGLDVVRPVWLCSPESVAALFPLEPGLFDLVIFDEASQCPVESAVPALVRTDRAVIAGDDQQMPPTHFFRAAQEEDFDAGDDEAALLASQSILDLARIALPNTTLRWHYRCRHESLIAFSNAAFYGRKLATAPNAERRARASWEGLRLERVDGRWVEQQNPVEAELVVDTLGRILGEEIPGEGPPSVGIVTFNRKQAELVEGLIEARASLDEAFRARVQRDRERPVIDQLFVRNLENVQGDERDVILMSLGYGPGEGGGRVHARFGPLGLDGGDKRLNVAITRARLGLWLFTSFEPEQLAVGQTKNVGPKLLEVYVRYARAIGRGDEGDAEACLAEAAELGGGRGVTARDGRLERAGRTGLAVRDALARALEQRGYRVKRDVGLGRLSLDLAVAGFDDAVFRVGVDCSAFLAESDAFTRDVYVPLFWQRLGWTLLRVTPGQWLEDERAVLKAIDEAVDRASTG